MLSDDLRYTGDDLPELALGQRAFEIVMARQMDKGELQTTWFERHGSTPITEIPTHWPAAYRKLVERRIKLIETNKEIGLIEKPEYKRRWNTEPWDEQEQRALKNWLLDRLEDKRYWPRIELQSTARLADRASGDAEFMQVAALYRGRPDFDVSALVAELVEGESVPFLPILRYKASGLRKRERLGTDLGAATRGGRRERRSATIPGAAQVRHGGLPEDRLLAAAGQARRAQGTLDQLPALLRPKAIRRWWSAGPAGITCSRRRPWSPTTTPASEKAGTAKRLTPLLAGLDQLLPWIHQWHPEIDKEFGETAGKSFQTMLEHDAHELGLTLEEIRQLDSRQRRPPGEASEEVTDARKAHQRHASTCRNGCARATSS